MLSFCHLFLGQIGHCRWSAKSFSQLSEGLALAVRTFRLTAMANMDSSAPIGIFDSGLGGLTVARAIIDQLPNEALIYFGDTARGPYGPRPLAEVRSFALEIMDSLVNAGVKAIVIACNTASAAMLRC